MSGPDWYRWNPSKWLAGTLALTNEQRGVYVQIINVILDRGSCPTDEAYLARLCNLTRRPLRRIIAELIALEKITREEDAFSQKKAKLERNLSETFVKNQANRASKRWGGNGLADANARVNLQPHIDSESETDSESLSAPTESSSKAEASPARSRARPAGPDGQQAGSKGNGLDPRGSRLSKDWEPSDDGIEYARKLGLSNIAIDDIYEAFMRYWLAKAGAAARKVSWDLTWQTWVRREHERLREQADREQARRERYGPPRR